MENKRVKNAQATEYDGKKFRSKLEVYCYKKLVELGVDFCYEEVKIDLISSLSLNRVRAFHPVKSGKRKGEWQEVFKINKKTYTPDFIIPNYLGYYMVIECKGFENDDFSSKRKLLLAHLEEEFDNIEVKPIYLEPHNQKQVNICIEFIKSLS
jgi:hypothetical protein